MDFGQFFQAMKNSLSLGESLPDLSSLDASAKPGKEQKSIALPELNFDGSEENTKEKVMLLKEIARALTDQSNYYGASSIFEIVEAHGDIHDLSTMLAMGECFLSLGRESKAMRCIKQLHAALLSEPSPSAMDAFEMIDCMAGAELYLRTLILVPVVAELYQRLESSDEAIEGMFRCVKKADECACPMIKGGGRPRILGIDFGLEFMKECLEDMLKMNNVDKRKLAIKHSHISSWLGFIHWLLHDNATGIKVRQRAICQMDDTFGPSASQYRIYSSNFYNIGVGYAILNKSDQAKGAYEKAISAAEQATDFDNDAAKQTELNSYRKKLRELQ